ncbi:MAG TPA: thioredoxin family protein [Longimicrobiales bacterium]|nr:thioredoxin family protein [Longimicrobiales bacterium]
MMKVQILGTGCSKCRALTANAETAISELGIDARIEKVEKIADIARMGAMMTPGLAVDGQLKATGVLPVSRVKEILSASMSDHTAAVRS